MKSLRANPGSKVEANWKLRIKEPEIDENVWQWNDMISVQVTQKAPKLRQQQMKDVERKRAFEIINPKIALADEFLPSS